MLRFLALKILPRLGRVGRFIGDEHRNKFYKDKWMAAWVNHGFLLGTSDAKAGGTWEKMVSGAFEESELGAVSAYIEQCDLFIDVGAHIGYYTCYAGSKNVKIIAFEPSRNNFASLCRNLRLNHVSAEVFNVALGNDKGTADLYGKDVRASLRTEAFASDQGKGEEVQVEMLDSYIEKLTGKIFLKIDVEGGEFPILQGARNFFGKNPPEYVYIENAPRWSKTDNPDFEKTWQFFMDRNYRAYHPDKTLHPIDEGQEGNYSMFFFVKNPVVKSK